MSLCSVSYTDLRGAPHHSAVPRRSFILVNKAPDGTFFLRFIVAGCWQRLRVWTRDSDGRRRIPSSVRVHDGGLGR